MAQYKRIPYEVVEHTEIAQSNYLDYERCKDAPDEAEIEAIWIAERKKLCQIMDKLTPRQRQVYIMMVGYELTEKEIAGKLGIAQQVVSRHYMAACKKIQKMFGK